MPDWHYRMQEKGTFEVLLCLKRGQKQVKRYIQMIQIYSDDLGRNKCRKREDKGVKRARHL